MKYFLFVLLVALPISAARCQQASETGRSNYSHDSKGLDKQLEVALRAYKDRKFTEVDKQFRRFVVPNAQKWFAQYFPPDRVQELAKRQAKAEDDWETGLTALMSFFPNGTRFRVRCSRDRSPTHKEAKALPGSILPVSPPPIEEYFLQFSADKASAFGARQFASVALLVYYEGAYRFVGDEDGPFWLAPPKQKSTKH